MAAPTICVFEDEQADAFLPLTYTRPVFDLRCGMSSLYEKIAAAYHGAQVRHLCRPFLARSAESEWRPSLIGNSRDRLQADRQVLFVNGRILAAKPLVDIISPDGEDTLYVSGEDLVAARLSGPRLTIGLKWLAEQDSQSVMATMAREVPVHRVDVRLVAYPWDLIHANGDQITQDFAGSGKRGHNNAIHAAAAVYNPDDVYVAPTAEVMAMVVLDAREGPIFIDDSASIQPFSYIQGPAYIGPHARVVGGKIREFTSIGPYCRVGGEVEATIFHSYTNKYHDGFIGHSYFGEWVNAGAMTTTSDLKNTYGSVRVDLGGRQFDTRLTKLRERGRRSRQAGHRGPA